jgi:ribosome-binding factor A
VQDRRLLRLQELIKEKVASVLAQDMADPRLGLVTITRVKLDRELSTCDIFWTVYGDEKKRRLNERTLKHAAGYVRREIASVLHTRNTPSVTFVFDESVAGELRVQQILKELRDARPPEVTPPEPDDESPTST